MIQQIKIREILAIQFLRYTYKASLKMKNDLNVYKSVLKKQFRKTNYKKKIYKYLMNK